MLFRVTDKPVREDNPSIDAIPEFRELTDKQLRYVILSTDYDTPLRQLAYKERKEQAAEDAGYARENNKRMNKPARDILAGKNKNIEAAITRYKALQRDIDRETLQAFDDQLEQFIQKTSEKKVENKDWEIALKITQALPKLIGMRKEILENLSLRGDFDEGDDRGDNVELSALDNFIKTQTDARK